MIRTLRELHRAIWNDVIKQIKANEDLEYWSSFNEKAVNNLYIHNEISTSLYNALLRYDSDAMCLAYSGRCNICGRNCRNGDYYKLLKHNGNKTNNTLQYADKILNVALSPSLFDNEEKLKYFEKKEQKYLKTHRPSYNVMKAVKEQLELNTSALKEIENMKLWSV